MIFVVVVVVVVFPFVCCFFFFISDHNSSWRRIQTVKDSIWNYLAVRSATCSRSIIPVFESE